MSVKTSFDVDVLDGIVVEIYDLCDDVLVLSATCSKSHMPRNFGHLVLSEFLLIDVLIDEIDTPLRHTHTGGF